MSPVVGLWAAAVPGFTACLFRLQFVLERTKGDLKERGEGNAKRTPQCRVRDKLNLSMSFLAGPRAVSGKKGQLKGSQHFLSNLGLPGEAAEK